MKKPAFLTSLFLAAGALASTFRSRATVPASYHPGMSPVQKVKNLGDPGSTGTITSEWSNHYERPAAAYGTPARRSGISASAAGISASGGPMDSPDTLRPTGLHMDTHRGPLACPLQPPGHPFQKTLKN